MPYTLVKTCYGCGATLFRQNITMNEASEYVKDIQFLGAQIGRVEEENRTIFLYDGLCPDCLREIFINNPIRTSPTKDNMDK